MNQDPPDRTRRNLVIATAAVGGAGVVAAAVPFVASMEPSAKARALGAPVEVDIGEVKPGDLLTISWRIKPVWILRRTPQMLQDIKKDDGILADPKSELPQQPKYAENEWRSIKPEWGVMLAVCTHLGCTPSFKPSPGGDMGPEWNGGFYCPCHGSKYDLAGRVYKSVPAPKNLEVPEYMYLSDTRILVGSDKNQKA